MSELLAWISGGAGLVTLIAYGWHVVSEFRMDRRRSTDYIRLGQSREDVWKYITSGEGLADDPHEPDGKLLSDVLKRFRETPSDQPGWAAFVRYVNATTSARRRPLANRAAPPRPPTPPTYRFLSRHVPDDLRNHREELGQFLQDGLAERGPRVPTSDPMNLPHHFSAMQNPARLRSPN